MAQPTWEGITLNVGSGGSSLAAETVSGKIFPAGVTVFCDGAGGVTAVEAVAGLPVVPQTGATWTVDLGANNDVTLATLPDTAAGDLAALVVDAAALEVLVTASNVLLGTIDTDTGAIATSAASIDGKVTACDTGAVVVSSGTITANLGATDNAVLDAIAASVAGTLTVGSHVVTNAGTFAVQSTLQAGSALVGKVGIDQTTPGTTNAVVASLAAAQTLATVTTVGTVGTVTNLAQLGGVAVSLNTGVRDTGTQRVTIATDDSVPVTGTFWQATQPVSGTITANLGATDNAVLDSIDASTLSVANILTESIVAEGALSETVVVVGAVDGSGNALAPLVDASRHLQVDVLTMPTTTVTGTVTANLSATDNAVLDAAVVLLGTIDADTDAIKTAVEGTLTVGSHPVTNAGTFAVQVDGAALTALQLIDDVVHVDDTATHATGTTKGVGIMAAATPTDSAVDVNDIGMVAMSVDRRLHVDAQIVGTDAALDVSAATVTVDGSGVTQPVSGTFWQTTQPVSGTVTANLSATDNAVLDAMVVDLAAMEVLLTAANVDHAANEVLLGTIAGDTTSIDGKITACNTGAVVVSSGTVTANLGATDNAVIDDIAARTSDPTVFADDAAFTVGTSKGQVAMGVFTADTIDAGDAGAFAIDASRRLMVSIEADNAGIGGGTQYTEDAAAAANPVGNAVILIRDDVPGALVTTDNDNVAQRGTNYGAAFCQIVDSSGNLVDSFGGGTAYTEDVATANPIVGTTTMMERDDILGGLTPAEGDWAALRCSAEGALWVQDFNSDAALAHLATIAGCTEGAEFQVDILEMPAVVISSGTTAVTNAGTFATQATLQTGANAIGKLAANSGVDIGDVDVTSIAAGTNTIGGTISQQSSSTLYDGTTACTIKRASGVMASTGTMIAAVGSKKFRILALFLKATSATVTNVWLGTTTDTDVLGNTGNPIPLAVDADGDNDSGFVMPYNQGGWTETSTVNEALTLTMSAAQDVIWAVTYIEVA